MSSPDRLQELKDDLWVRWMAYALEPSVPAEPHGTRVVYSRRGRFDLSNWSSPGIVAGGRLSPDRLEKRVHAYALDESGRPLISSYPADSNIGWRGEFRYSPDEIEYREFYLPTKLLADYVRVTFRDGCRLSYQRLMLNTRGSAPAWATLPRADLVARMQSRPLDYDLTVEAYDIADRRIHAGKSLTVGLGAPSTVWSLEFTYLVDGLLGTVARRAPDGSLQTLFARRSERSLAELSSILSQRIADRVLDEAGRRAFATPRVLIELGYRRGDLYSLPFVTYSTVEDFEDFPVLQVPAVREGFGIDDDDVGAEFAEFVARLDEDDEWYAQVAMMRKAARLITADASTHIPRTADFVAIAIDWELEGEDASVREILAECGASPQVFASWEARGWLR